MKPATELDTAAARLMSLNDGDRGVLEIIRIGQAATPRLRYLLFEREPSGLFQSRCRVVEALSALNARAVLLEFLYADRYIRDPVERAGEEAVINAVARALRRGVDEAVFQRLLLLAESRKLAGPIEVIGETRRLEALPCLVAALKDDLARPVAEAALQKFGTAATSTLLAAASVAVAEETESGRRARRAALKLLYATDPLPTTTPTTRDGWRDDPDPEIALLGCRMALTQGDQSERDITVLRLIGMLYGADWRTRGEIEDLLCGSAGSEVLRDALSQVALVDQEDQSPVAGAHRSLLRVKTRLRARGPKGRNLLC